MDYEKIVTENIDFVYRMSLCYCKNQRDAEDVVQNTFLKLIQSKQEFADDAHIRKWLVRVAVNECKNIWKSYWNRNVISLDTLEYELEMTRTEEQQELLQAVMALSPKYRIVVHLYYYEGYHVKEIADMLHLSESNVQIRLMRARKKLKDLLEEESVYQSRQQGC
ncbi:MAG: RNA polymerase sigma factor [Lachnospiraceae bacterium]|nr:RNA polymerase sigma factor [Lachnospiraceae bacterium]